MAAGSPRGRLPERAPPPPRCAATRPDLRRDGSVDLVGTFQTLAISLGLGLLVGTQRERVEAPIAGVRTFALITVLGTVMALLAETHGAWTVAAGLAAVAVAIAVGNVAALQQDRADAGITTEIAILLMYGIGAYLVHGHREVAVVASGGIALLLHAKAIMHGFVRRLGETDMRVMMQFVLMSLVILPVLPDRAYGPFRVLNPREIWWMVVLVVGIGLAGYVAFKLFGRRAGTLLAGLLGGLISSTATTVSVARRAAGRDAGTAAPLLVIVLASAVVYARVLVEVFVVAGAGAFAIASPVAVMLAAAAASAAALWRATRGEAIEMPGHENPTELRPALVFGALYAIVLLAAVAARHALGDRGVYVAAGISGLTDMDAITLSVSRMSAQAIVTTDVAWRSIVIAVLSNLAFKAGVVTLLGGPALGRRTAGMFAIQAATGAALLWLWPG